MPRQSQNVLRLADNFLVQAIANAFQLDSLIVRSFARSSSERIYDSLWCELCSFKSVESTTAHQRKDVL